MVALLTGVLDLRALIVLMVVTVAVVVYMVHLELLVEQEVLGASLEGEEVAVDLKDLVMPTLEQEVLVVQEKFGYGQ